MASKLFPAILIAVVIWLGTQVWRDSSESLKNRSPAPAPKATLVPPSARPPAIDFALQSTDGETVRLSSFRGRSPVILNFFATWCLGCREELPHLVDLYNRYRQAGLEVIMVSDEPVDLLKEYAAGMQIPFRVVSDPRREAHSGYGVTATPLTLLIDRDGKIAMGLHGYAPTRFMDEFVPAVGQIMKG